MEEIQAHVVSVWREPRGFFSIGGKEGMLVLTNRRLAFIHKTEAKVRWWQAIVARQIVSIIRTQNVMNVHDGYNMENFEEDITNKKNTVLGFDDILEISHEEKQWGAALYIKHQEGGCVKNYQYMVAQDWVKYPIKDPTKFMKVNWWPFVMYIRRHQTITP